MRPPTRIAMIDVANPAGKEAWISLSHWDEADLVVAIDHHEVGKSMRDLCGPKGADVQIEAKLGEALDRVKVDVMIDFGNHAAAAQHAGSALKRGVIPIIGVMLNSDEIKDIRAQCATYGCAALISPTFSVGGVLMQRFCRESAKWLGEAAILDYSPEGKQGAPSAGAKQLAEGIAASIEAVRHSRPERFGERTTTWQDISISSIGCKGLVPRSAAIFGTTGETLTIDHVFHGPAAWSAGLKIAIREIQRKTGLVVGLDNLLFS